MVQILSPVGTNVASPTSTLDFPLFTRAYGVDGSEWIYALANSAITQYMAIGVAFAGSANPLTKAIADAGNRIGIAQATFTAGQYGWFLSRGGTGTYYVKAKNSCAISVALYTTGTAGFLDDTAASQTNVAGIVLRDTATSSGAAEECDIFAELRAGATA